jgi:hypothetical protein
VITIEDAHNLARQQGKNLSNDLLAAMREPKPARKSRKTKKGARPRTLKELAAFLDDQPDVPKSAPEFVLMIDEKFSRLDSPTSTVPIDYKWNPRKSPSPVRGAVHPWRKLVKTR